MAIGSHRVERAASARQAQRLDRDDVRAEAGEAPLLPGGHPQRLAEPLLERVVEAPHALDGQRIVQDGVGAACFGGPVVQRPEERLRHAARRTAAAPPPGVSVRPVTASARDARRAGMDPG
jgi:hypothetical protein